MSTSDKYLEDANLSSSLRDTSAAHKLFVNTAEVDLNIESKKNKDRAEHNTPTADRESEGGRRSSRTPKRNTIYEEDCIPEPQVLNSNDAVTRTRGTTNKHTGVNNVEDDDDNAFPARTSDPATFNDFPVLQSYFLERLEQVITFFGAAPGTVSTWRVEVIRRVGGLSLGTVDVYYFNSRNKKYKSRVEVAVSLGLMPAIVQIRNMTRHQHYIAAMELRERFLVSQLVGAHPEGTYDRVAYNDDHVVFLKQHQPLPYLVPVTSPGRLSNGTYSKTLSPRCLTESTLETEDNGALDEEKIVSAAVTLANFPSLVSPRQKLEMETDPDEHQHITSTSTAKLPSTSEFTPPMTSSPVFDVINRPFEHFTLGNVVILDWGQIIPESQFHTKTQLFPVGFRCIRLEHDVVLDRPIECLCEIDTISDEISEDKHPTLRPLFRVTVAWEVPVIVTPTTATPTPAPDRVHSPSSTIPNGDYSQSSQALDPSAPLSEKGPTEQIEVPDTSLTQSQVIKFVKVSKVYEGMTPQQVWQAVLLETSGLTPVPEHQMKPQAHSQIKAIKKEATSITPAVPTLNLSEEKDVSVHLVGETSSSVATVTSNSPLFSPINSLNASLIIGADIADVKPDTDELLLRAAVREHRKTYFRAMRTQQMLGIQAPVRPRLDLDNVENFNDDLITRMIEGMKSSLECTGYYFVASREKDGGRKGNFNGLTRLTEKAKEFERLLLRAYPVNLNPSKRKGKDWRKGLKTKRLRTDEFTQDGEALVDHNDSINGGLMSGYGENQELYTEENDASKDASRKAGAGSTLTKAQLRAKIRDVDKTVKLMRESILRGLKRRKDEARLRVEIMCDAEEASGNASHLPLSSPLPDWAAIPVQVQRPPDFESAITDISAHRATSSEDMSQTQQQLDHPHFKPTAVVASSSLVAVPTPVTLGSDVFARLMELWHMVTTYTAPLNLQSPPPTLAQWLSAMYACDKRIKVLDTCTRPPSYRSLFTPPSTSTSVTSSNFSQSTSTTSITAATVTSSAAADGVFPSNTISNTNTTVPPYEAQGSNIMETLAIELCKFLLPEFAKYTGMETGADPLTMFPLNQLTWREIYRVALFGAMCKELGLTEMDLAMTIRGKTYTQYVDVPDRFILRLARGRISAEYNNREENREALCGFTSGVCVSCPAPCSYSGSFVPLSEILRTAVNVPSNEPWLVLELLERAISWCEFHSDIRETENIRVRLEALLRCGFIRADDASRCQDVLIQFVAIIDDSDLTGAKVTLDEDSLFNRLAAVDEKNYESCKSMAAPSILCLQRKCGRDLSFRRTTVAEEEIMAPTSLEPTGEEDDEEVGLRVVGVDENATALHEAEAVATAVESLHDIRDEEDATRLSVAMQRCYVVIRDLMAFPLAHGFNWPVDVQKYPHYGLTVSQPLSLSDIRQHLIKGGYEGDIFAFYSDVTLLFDNAIFYNLDHTAMNKTALKLLAIFERMFLECVLEWESPMTSTEFCHSCNGASAETEVITCDRCAANYHVGCLTATDKSVMPPVGKEWICPGCIDERCVANVHPDKFSHVRHPSDNDIVGDVVGIEQYRGALQFTVEFGLGRLREVWPADKLRKYRVEPAAELPSGYDIDDYDAVCGLARGNTGWGGSHFAEPLTLSEVHSLPAKLRNQKDSHYSLCRSVMCLLSSSGGSEEYTPEEWILLLRVLMLRIFAISPFRFINDKLEGELENLTVSQCTADQLPAFLTTNCKLLADVPELSGYCFFLASSTGDSEGLPESIEVELTEDTEYATGSDGADDTHTGVVNKPTLSRITTVENSEDAFEMEETDLTSSQEVSKKPKGKGYDNEIQKTDAEADNALASVDGDDGDTLDISPAIFGRSHSLSIGGIENTSSWELRRQSRRKAREDALLVTEMLLEGLGDLANEAMLNEDESYFDTFNAAVIRSMSIQAAEEQFDPTEWESAYTAQFSAIQARLGFPAVSGLEAAIDGAVDVELRTSIPSDDDFKVTNDVRDTLPVLRKNSSPCTLVCQYCGFEDIHLSNAFVWGQTLQEWELERKEIEAENSVAKSTTSRKRVWIPIERCAAEVELTECELQGSLAGEINETVAVHKGTLVTHETCANLTYNLRIDNYEKIERAKQQRLLDIVTGHTRAKTTPLGQDAMGNLFWYFSDFPLYLFLCSPSFDVGFKQCDIASFPPELIPPSSAPCLPNSNSVWSVYTTQEQIIQVLRQLNKKDRKEEFLFRALSVLYPDAAIAAVVSLSSINLGAEFDLTTSVKDPLEGLSLDSVIKLVSPSLANELSSVAGGSSKQARGKYGDIKSETNSTAGPASESNPVDDDSCLMDIIDNSIIESNQTEVAASSNNSAQAISFAAEDIVRSPLIKPNSNPSIESADDDDDDEWDESDMGNQIVYNGSTVSADTTVISKLSPLNSGTSSKGTTPRTPRVTANTANSVIYLPSTTNACTATTTTLCNDQDVDANVNGEETEDALDVVDKLDTFAFNYRFRVAQNSRSRPASLGKGKPCFEVAQNRLKNNAEEINSILGKAVFVEDGAKNPIFSGRIISIRKTIVPQVPIWTPMLASNTVPLTSRPPKYPSYECKVTYPEWGFGYERWVSADAVYLVPGTDEHLFRQMGSRLDRVRIQHIDGVNEEIPTVLQSLNAATYYNATGRHCTHVPSTYSVLKGQNRKCGGATLNLWLLKKGLLLVEAALPYGSLDKSDDKWGRKNFGQAWREAVVSSKDATGLMQCQLLLEHCIKQHWIKPSIVRLFSVLPSRSLATRNATIGMVALRLWALDQSIKYEKIEKEAARKSCHQSVLASAISGKGRGRPTATALSEDEDDQDEEEMEFEKFVPAKKSQQKRKR